ncbi:MAG TPA: type II secretion system protein GspM [Desulfosalsimonadaceae bacterium]|nr:type II secretion system protein GspM [Desulfosalsimonadaceae bacterium]
MININLNQREKIIVYGAGLFIAAFALVQLIIMPVFEKRDELQRKLDAKHQTLSEMQQLRAEYQELRQRIAASRNQFDRRPANFTLFSFMDRLAGQAGIKQHVSYMKPSTTVNDDTGVTLSRVEMELQGISLKDLTKYLYNVETSKNMVMIKRLSISRTGRDSALIDAVLQAETVET